MKKNLIIYAKNIILLIIIAFCSFLIAGFLRPIVELKIDEAKINLNPNKKVEIVFITDKNYMNYLRVAIKSAIVNKNKDSIYNISILCVDLSDDDMALIKELEKTDDGGEKNITINTIPLSLDLVKDVTPDKINSLWKTKADLYRFLIPEILKDVDKVLYLDSDIIVLGDLSHLYNMDISNKYLGAIINSAWSQLQKPTKIIGSFYYHGTFKKEFLLYNGGVLLLNLKKMRKDGISGKLIKFQNSEEGQRDSDWTFNKVIPFHTIRSLAPIYNFVLDKRMEGNLEYYNHYWGKNIKSSDEFIKQAEILHLKDKPWKNKTAPFADLWWKYAEMVGVDE